MDWLDEIAKTENLTPRQVQLIWYRGQIGVNGGDKRGNKKAPKYFTAIGLTAKGKQIYTDAEVLRRSSISMSLKKMAAEF